MTKEHTRGYKRKCKYCGKVYWSGNAKGRYCSDAHRMAAFREKHKRDDGTSLVSSQWNEILDKHEVG
jgi:hypothetical protein